MTTAWRPLVSIVMPVRNEAAYIRRSLGAVLAQDYPAERMEILVVDGMSTDGTRDIVRETFERSNVPTLKHSDLRLLDNPHRIVPSALNIGLAQAQGEVIIRVDGHCEIAPDYVRQCVAYLARTDVACVGGPIETVGETPMARAIALAMSSPFGVGSAAFRTGVARERYVDTLAFGAYRREVFDRIGGFDEELVRNQDDEFNFRLTQSGGKILLTPAIRSTYYSRATLRGLWRQYYQYGFYKVRVMQKRRGIASWRHLVPAVFVLLLALSVSWAALSRRPLRALTVAGPYLVANGLASAEVSRGEGTVYLHLPLVFASLHLAYGIGFLGGLWRWRRRW